MPEAARSHKTGSSISHDAGSTIVIKHLGRSSSNGWGNSDHDDVTIKSDRNPSIAALYAAVKQKVDKRGDPSTHMEKLYHVSPAGEEVELNETDRRRLEESGFTDGCELVVKSDTLVAGMSGGVWDGTFNSSLC